MTPQLFILDGLIQLAHPRREVDPLRAEPECPPVHLFSLSPLHPTILSSRKALHSIRLICGLALVFIFVCVRLYAH